MGADSLSAAPGAVVTLCGPSASGKSRIAEELVRHFGFFEVVSTTTRPPRSGERDGTHYHFTDRDTFLSGVASGRFVEYFEFSGNLYGNTVEEYSRRLAQGHNVVAVVEPNGAQAINNRCRLERWRCASAFIDAPAQLLMARQIERLRAEQYSGTKAALGRCVARMLCTLGEERGWVSAIPYARVFHRSDSPERAHRIAGEISTLARQARVPGLMAAPRRSEGLSGHARQRLGARIEEILTGSGQVDAGSLGGMIMQAADEVRAAEKPCEGAGVELRLP